MYFCLFLITSKSINNKLIINMIIKDDFTCRHNGPAVSEQQKMLDVIGVKTMDELIEKRWTN